MPYRIVPFENDYFYHIFNRGVEKRITFADDRDYQRFTNILYYYQFAGPKPSFSQHKRFPLINFDQNERIVEILSYCLMPNHFHILLKQTHDNGVHEFARKVLNSYTKYFNTRHNRIGPLFQGQFKAVFVEADEQLIHLSRYIHLNPFVSELTKNWEGYKYSSIRELKKHGLKICLTNPLLDFFKSTADYLAFVRDNQDYGLELARIKHLVIEDL